MRFPAMNERYKFWQGWTLALKIINILALYVLKISGSFGKSGKNALRIYPPPPNVYTTLCYIPGCLIYGLNFFFRIKLLYKNQYRKITFLPLDKKKDPQALSYSCQHKPRESTYDKLRCEWVLT